MENIKSLDTKYFIPGKHEFLRGQDAEHRLPGGPHPPLHQLQVPYMSATQMSAQLLALSLIYSSSSSSSSWLSW